jgi:hypothetical protein
LVVGGMNDAICKKVELNNLEIEREVRKERRVRERRKRWWCKA